MPTATVDQLGDAVASIDHRSSAGRCLTGRLVTGRLVEGLPRHSYVAFRIAFGLVAAVGQVRFVARGWVDKFYVDPSHHLTYVGFEWVRPLPPLLMYGVVSGLAVLGVLVAFGIRTRLAAGAFAIGFAYCELIDAALYLNHYWLLTLAAILLAVLPASTGDVVPAITVWALRAQLACVYVFAGIAKLNSDWLLRAEPLQTWLAARTDRPLIGAMFDEPVAAYAFSWVGAAFDLTIVGWLLWRRTRPVAYAVLVVFHIMTAALFQIGMFPWVMIVLTPIFFDPAWPARLLGGSSRRPSDGIENDRPVHIRRVTMLVLAVLLALNVVLPLRHLAAEGNVRWNDDGYLLAWRVMLTERASDVVFSVRDPATGQTDVVDIATVLTEWQTSAAIVRADLILATAHVIADDRRDQLGRDVEVYADAVVAWNGRLRTQWIDSDVDLAGLARSARASEYVLDEPNGE
jgi:vitamin K-dependent gamma-carboxylase